MAQVLKQNDRGQLRCIQNDRERLMLQLRRIQEDLIYMISTPDFPVVVESRMLGMKGRHGYSFRIEPANELYKFRIVIDDLHYTDEQLLMEVFNQFERKINRG